MYLWRFLHTQKGLPGALFGIWIMPQRSRTTNSLQEPRPNPRHSEGMFLGIPDTSSVQGATRLQQHAKDVYNLTPCPKLKNIIFRVIL